MEDLYEVFFEDGSLVLAEMSSATRRMSVTYGAVKRDIENLAAEICRRKVCDRCIGLYGENSVRWITAFWAILKSGNMPYLMNLRQPTAFSDRILGSLDAAFVLDCDGKCPTEKTKLLFSDLSEAAKKAGGAEAFPTFCDRFAISTNGTTLREKVCFYDGDRIANQLLNINSMLGQAPDLVKPYRGKLKPLAFLPLYHIFGLEAMYFWYSLFGATFVFLSDMNPDTILRTVRKHEVTHIFAVPLLWHGLEKNLTKNLQSKPEETRKKFEKASGAVLKLWDISPALGRAAARKFFGAVRENIFGDSVQFCISGGSFISPSALKLINSLGYPLYNGYGMTEVGITSVELSKKASHRLLGSIGKPFASVEYSVGEKGQLLIRGTSLCRSMRVDGVSAETLGDFDTGDIVRIDASGRAYISGRISDLVFGDDGENLNPDFAEQGFSLPGALGFSVTGSSDNTKLCLVVRVDESAGEEEIACLNREIRLQNEALPVSYRVKEIIFTADPIAPAGAIKVSRAYLRRGLENGTIRPLDLGAKAPSAEPGDPESGSGDIKAVLREVFADILGVEESAITDDGHFMNDLGGSSLDYFTLIGEINARFGISLDFEADKFGYTLGDFEKIIRELVD
ncbi:MAG: AMP-binding protein [Clostridia bacterium]|nr:AMP-binding protein [Clostridia bacterium]